MSAPNPAPLPGYSLAHRHLADIIVAAWPDRPWLKKTLAATAVLSTVADLAVARHFAREDKNAPTRADLERELAKFYEEKAKEIASPSSVQGQAQTQQQQVNVTVNLPSADAKAAPSLYLLEEGNPNLDTDCFSCASAHLAGMEGALVRAKHAAEREGGCGDECRKWLTLAAQEPSALFARDWTPEKMARWPEWQREVVEAYAPKVREIQRKIVRDDTGQLEALVDGAAALKESVRFAEAGDGLDHPEVDWRLRRAEADLASAERVEVGTLPPDVSQELRRLRQEVGSKLGTPDDLVRAARKADEVSQRALADRFADMTPEEIGRLADQVHDLRARFRRDRRELASRYQAMIGTVRPRRPSDAHIPRHVVERFTLPSEEVVAEVTDRENIARSYDNLEQRVEERGVKVRYRNLPSTFDETLFGLYDPDTDTILLDSFTKTARDSFAFQVLAHETSHALVDGPRCYNSGYVEGVEYEEQPSELRAQAASLAAMVELGLPVELSDGTELAPGERVVDWQKLESVAGPEVARDARWAAEWIVRAARGEDGQLAVEACPARR